jgi:GNAT superfamily N-acetyltransferase
MPAIGDFMDLDMSRRLERTEAAVSSTFPAVKQRLMPEVGAAWRDFAGTYAIFDGLDSPLSQTFGIGLFEPLTPELLSEIEAFFEERGAPVQHEVSPLAGIATLRLLAERDYRPVELSTVLVQRIEESSSVPAPRDLRVRVIEPADHAAWIETSVMGWSEDPAIAHIIRPVAELSCANDAMVRFVVERDGAPIGTGSLGVHAGVALLAGASTIPSARGAGAQALLLSARLAEAQRRGCEIAMMVTAPGGTSQRNAERRGFRVAYTRTKWGLSRPTKGDK